MKTAAATLHWHCLTPGCDEHGLTTGTDTGQDAKHVKATGHGTTTSVREWVSHAGTPVDSIHRGVGLGADNGQQGHDQTSRPPSKGAVTPLEGLADRKDTTDS